MVAESKCATASFTICEGTSIKCLDYCRDCCRSVYCAGPGVSGGLTGRAVRHRFAQDAVNELEDNGFKVVLNKMGAGPLDHCTVDSVRPGATVTRPVQNGGGLVNQIVYQTVYLTAKC